MIHLKINHNIHRKRQEHVYNPDDDGGRDTNVNLQTSSPSLTLPTEGNRNFQIAEKSKNSKSKWRNPVRIPDPTQSRPLQSTSHPSPPSLLLLPPLVSTSPVVAPSRCNLLLATALSRACSTIPAARRYQSAETKP